MRSLVPLATRILAPLVLALAACPGHKAAPESVAADALVAAATRPSSSAVPAPGSGGTGNEPPDIVAVQGEADGWRRAHRLIDMHEHVGPDAEDLARAVKIHDAVGIGLAVNLSGGTVTPHPDIPGGGSVLEYTRTLANKLYPGRFLQYMNLDYAAWDAPDFARQAVAQVERGARLGAAGFKEYKRLGLYLRDRAGKLIAIDDPKLDGVWRRCGELGLPVSIHVADPRAFWLPLNPSNERGTSSRTTRPGGSATLSSTLRAKRCWPRSTASSTVTRRRRSCRSTSARTRRTLPGSTRRWIAIRTCGLTWRRVSPRLAGTTPTRSTASS